MDQNSYIDGMHWKSVTVWDKFMCRYQEDIYVSVPQYGAATVDLNTWFRVTFHHTAAGCHINTCSVFGGSLLLFFVTLTNVLTAFSSVVISCQLVFLPYASSSLFSTDLIFRTLCLCLSFSLPVFCWLCAVVWRVRSTPSNRPLSVLMIARGFLNMCVYQGAPLPAPPFRPGEPKNYGSVARYLSQMYSPWPGGELCG